MNITILLNIKIFHFQFNIFSHFIFSYFFLDNVNMRKGDCFVEPKLFEWHILSGEVQYQHVLCTQCSPRIPSTSLHWRDSEHANLHGCYPVHWSTVLFSSIYSFIAIKAIRDEKTLRNNVNQLTWRFPEKNVILFLFTHCRQFFGIYFNTFKVSKNWQWSLLIFFLYISINV